MNEEDQILEIVELKRGRKNLNKALRWKWYDMTFAITDVYFVCDSLKKYLDGGNILYLLHAGFMGFFYAAFLYYSRLNSEIIDNNLDKDIELEEYLEQEELSK